MQLEDSSATQSAWMRRNSAVTLWKHALLDSVLNNDVNRGVVSKACVGFMVGRESDVGVGRALIA